MEILIRVPKFYFCFLAVVFGGYFNSVLAQSTAKALSVGTIAIPNSSAVLDVVATNKGFLPPRVTLTSSTDALTIASPATGLTVYHTGNGNLTAGLYINIGTPASPNWVAGTGTQDRTNDAWVDDPANQSVKLGTNSNGTARAANADVVANDSGYLGLGTSIPTSRLHIIGTGDANDDIKISSTSTSGGTGTLLFARSRGTGAVQNGDILGSLLFRGSDGTNEIGSAGILAVANTNATANTVPTDITFATGTTTYSERMRLTSGGNLGIGNNNPGVRLAVTAAGDMNGINLTNNTSVVGTRTRFGIGAGNPNWAALYYTNVSSTVGRFGIGDYVTSGEYLSIPTSGGNQGNVGIGITDPTAKLEINGNLKIGTVVSSAGSSDVSTLVRDNITGEVKVATSSTGNSATINYVKYVLSNVNKDWVDNFNTNISTSQYTMVVVGSSFDQQALRTTVSGADYNPLNVVAYQSGGTWRLRADYSGGDSANNGTWTLYCLVINNSTVKILPDVTSNLGGTNSGSAASPSGL